MSDAKAIAAVVPNAPKSIRYIEGYACFLLLTEAGDHVLTEASDRIYYDDYQVQSPLVGAPQLSLIPKGRGGSQTVIAPQLSLIPKARVLNG